MFNLNDPRWGRGATCRPTRRPRARCSTGKGPNQGPPDLDELWRDFNRKLGGLFGGKGKRRGNGGGGYGGGSGTSSPT